MCKDYGRAARLYFFLYRSSRKRDGQLTPHLEPTHTNHPCHPSRPLRRAQHAPHSSSTSVPHPPHPLAPSSPLRPYPLTRPCTHRTPVELTFHPILAQNSANDNTTLLPRVLLYRSCGVRNRPCDAKLLVDVRSRGRRRVSGDRRTRIPTAQRSSLGS